MIEDKTRGEMIQTILSLLGPAAFVLAPLVYIRATRAQRLIDQHGAGEAYRAQTRALRALAVSVLLTQAALAAWVAFAVAALLRFGG